MQKVPNALIVYEYNRLEEARFDTYLMEHALFIRLGLPADEPELAAEAESLQEKFQQLLKRLNKTNKLGRELLEDLIKAVREIIAYKAKVLSEIIQCKKMPGSNYPLLLDHIRREAERFLNLLTLPVPEDPLTLLLQQEVFWLRIRRAYKFIIHLLDPWKATA